MKIFNLILMLCFFISIVSAQTTTSFQELLNEFENQYSVRYARKIRLSYKDNLEGIASDHSRAKQKGILLKFQKELERISDKELSGNDRINYEILKYEINLNLERLELETRFRQENPFFKMPEDELYQIDLSKEWYQYFLKAWTGTNISPRQAMRYGLKEIKRVENEIKTLQREAGFKNNSQIFYQIINHDSLSAHNIDDIGAIYTSLDSLARHNLKKVFSDTVVSELYVKKSYSKLSKNTSAYYSSNNSTFFYSTNEPLGYKRKMQFTYIHEGIPGHHYQMHFPTNADIAGFRKHVYYGIYVEGWAAYCEDRMIGEALGLYNNFTDYYSKLEWDLIRGVRIVMDAGINYYGWSKEEAWVFWKKHLPYQDGLFERELNRAIQWPVQSLTYRIGANKLLELRKYYQRKLGDKFDIRLFHQKILEYGSMPLFILEKHMKETVYEVKPKNELACTPNAETL